MRSLSSHGYVLVKRPDHPSAHRGWVYEHRIVAEEEIGRPLRSDEHVHHLNGDQEDNRPENLEVLLAGDHHRAHRKPGIRIGRDFLREVRCCDCPRTRWLWTSLNSEAVAVRYPRCKSCAKKLWHAQRGAHS